MAQRDRSDSPQVEFADGALKRLILQRILDRWSWDDELDGARTKGLAPHRHLRGKTEAEVGIAPMHVWRAWEDTSADTGYYLGAMSYRYRCSGDAATIDAEGHSVDPIECSFIDNLFCESEVNIMFRKSWAKDDYV